jgi:sulfotransferase family protein
MHRNINKPIFVLGSPRSGTSILTWCLGQHPNIFPVPESNWMGDFAVNIAMAYQVGAARGDRSILSAMDIQEDEMFATFGQTINDLILSHRKDLERKRQSRSALWGLKGRWFHGTSAPSEPKARWVDGTPEYSLFICGLRKLFPDARFVHVFRDVDAVVRSMLNFQRVAGTQLVANEEEAYKYWLRTVRACLKAEQAYGPDVVHRVRYADLIDNPESAIGSILDFLGEPYSAKCLEPLGERINSSNVPPDFKANDPATNPAVIEKATRLCAKVSETPQPARPSREIADKIEAAFRERVNYTSGIDRAYKKTREIIKALNHSALPLYVITQAALAIADPCVTALSQLS